MSNYKQNNQSSPTRLYNLSPEKYGKSAFKQLSYTPDKLSENVLYKQITIVKKMENQKKRIRELQSENTMCYQKNKQLQTQIETIKKSLLLQIQMYKQMLKDQQQEKAKHIKSMQISFNAEYSHILSEHQQSSKVAQAQKQQLQQKIQQLLSKLEQTEYKLQNSNNQGQQLSNQLKLTLQSLRNTQQKLAKSQQLSKLNNQRSSNQIRSLNQRLDKQRLNFKTQIQNTIHQKNRQIDGINKMHITQMEKLQNRRVAEMSQKNLELNELRSTFENQGRRLDQIINNKDRVNANFNTDLNKEKQRVLLLTKHYQNQINKLLNQKGHILVDLEDTQKQRNQFKIQVQQLNLQLDQQRNKSDALIRSLDAQLNMKTGQLLRQNQNLIRTIDQYQQQISFLKNQNRQIQHQRHIDSTKVKMANQHYIQQNRHLNLQVKNLREVLLQSSLQMEKCKQQFIRMDHERQRLLRLSKDYEQQNTRMHIIISERQSQLRQWRQSYFSLKSRY